MFFGSSCFKSPTGTSPTDPSVCITILKMIKDGKPQPGGDPKPSRRSVSEVESLWVSSKPKTVFFIYHCDHTFPQNISRDYESHMNVDSACLKSAWTVERHQSMGEVQHPSQSPIRVSRTQPVVQTRVNSWPKWQERRGLRMDQQLELLLLKRLINRRRRNND